MTVLHLQTGTSLLDSILLHHRPITDQDSLDCDWLVCSDGNIRLDVTSEEQRGGEAAQEVVYTTKIWVPSTVP